MAALEDRRGADDAARSSGEATIKFPSAEALASTAHQVNNCLSIILGHAWFLEEEEMDVGEVRGSAASIERAALRARDAIAQMRSLLPSNLNVTSR